jgi:acyl transferase domain-containing protein
MIRQKDCNESFLAACGQLFQHGVHVDWEQTIGHGKVATDIPSYAYDHGTSFWFESRISADWRLREYPQHVLLGYRAPEAPVTQPTWRNQLSLEDVPWLHDHKVRTDIVLPFAGYVAIAGEAYRQISGRQDGFALYHCLAKGAVVLTEGKAVEMVTTLQPHRLTDRSLATTWDIFISSKVGPNWTVSFEAQVGPKPVKAPSTVASLADLPRKVETKKWYNAMGETGLVFGPSFRALSNISASVTQNLAAAIIQCDHGLSQSEFTMHPVMIDAALQLALCARARGTRRGLLELPVPVIIETIVVSPSMGPISAYAWAHDEANNGIQALSEEGHDALRISEISFTPLEDERRSTGLDKEAAARLHWRQHFDFVNHKALFQTADGIDTRCRHEIEGLVLLCILDSLERISDLKPAQPHWANYRDWLRLVKDEAEKGRHAVLTDITSLTALDRHNRSQQIDKYTQRISEFEGSGALLEAALRIWRNIEDLFVGDREALDILVEDDVLANHYKSVTLDYSPFMTTLAHTKPNMRIVSTCITLPLARPHQY